MADTKISELPNATSVDSPDLVPIVQAGETKKAAVSLFQLFLKFIGLDFTGATWQFVNASGMWTDTIGNDNFLLGVLAGAVLTDPGHANTAFGFKAFEAAHTIGDGNVGVGQHVFNTRDVTGSFNTLVGSLAHLSDENINNAVGVGENVNVGEGSIAIGGATRAGGIGGITIGYNVTNNDDHIAVIGDDLLTDISFGSTSGNAILHGKGDAIVFPDSDPHVAGAAYWVLGVLTRSAG